ncbi:probable serine/threonine-protein kinase DDB_G0277165 [Rhagoletis pomonella]|uniref:probable serine/threonine-protein kinase DDB_G0277165 n=1 Tax=Rhagoletis pomonella TaxID=28610 RepID=UPI0017807D44|nr:probable serine/threonine-protein kinase DDB_G0277165 [Rhagoletis pomonella]
MDFAPNRYYYYHPKNNQTKISGSQPPNCKLFGSKHNNGRDNIYSTYSSAKSGNGYNNNNNYNRDRFTSSASSSSSSFTTSTQLQSNRQYSSPFSSSTVSKLPINPFLATSPFLLPCRRGKEEVNSKRSNVSNNNSHSISSAHFNQSFNQAPLQHHQRNTASVVPPPSSTSPALSTTAETPFCNHLTAAAAAAAAQRTFLHDYDRKFSLLSLFKNPYKYTTDRRSSSFSSRVWGSNDVVLPSAPSNVTSMLTSTYSKISQGPASSNTILPWKIMSSASQPNSLHQSTMNPTFQEPSNAESRKNAFSSMVRNHTCVTGKDVFGGLQDQTN